MSENQAQNVNNQEDDFTSTKGSGNTWNPKANEENIPYAPENRVYDATKQPNHSEKDVLIGYWVDKKEGVGKHKSTVISVVEKSTGKKFDVWLDTVLDGEFNKVPAMNILVKIEWLGTGLKKNMKEGQKGATYNLWSVGYKEKDTYNGGATVAVTPSVSNTKSENPQQSTPAATNISVSSTNDNDDLPF